MKREGMVMTLAMTLMTLRRAATTTPMPTLATLMMMASKRPRPHLQLLQPKRLPLRHRRCYHLYVNGRPPLSPLHPWLRCISVVHP